MAQFGHLKILELFAVDEGNLRRNTYHTAKEIVEKLQVDKLGVPFESIAVYLRESSDYGLSIPRHRFISRLIVPGRYIHSVEVRDEDNGGWKLDHTVAAVICENQDDNSGVYETDESVGEW